MIDVTSPNTLLINLAEAARIMGVNRSTIYRYAKQGYGGRRLEVVFVGGHRRTTREAIQRFLQDSTAAHVLPPGMQIDEALKRHGIE